MAKLTVRSRAMLAWLAALALAPACAKHSQPPTTAERAEVAHGEMKTSDSMIATVDSVDRANRTVFLHDEDGRHFAVEAQPDAAERLMPEDRIKVVYQESIAFALKDPKKAGANQKTKVQDLTRQEGQNEVQYGRKVETTVQILNVAANGTAVEFRAPEGQVRTVAIDEPANQKKVAALRPGDKVAVTYVEKLALALDEHTPNSEYTPSNEYPPRNEYSPSSEY